jgi:hypothetical protein
MSERAIATIKIGQRHRKDIGDVGPLAASMGELGLLHPVVITPDGKLIAGQRRVRAAESLGWTKIPVTVIDLDSVLRGEFAENTCRKDFTLSEAVAIKRALEPLEKAAAKERQRTGGRAGGKASGNLPQASTGRAADKAARATGMARRTLEKAEAIVDAAQAEPEKFGKLLADMDRTGRANGVYRRLKIAKQAEEIRKEPPPLPGNGPYRVIVCDVALRKTRLGSESPRRAAVPHNLNRRDLQTSGGLDRRPGLHPVVLGHEPSHARGFRDPRCMGIRAKDDSHLGQGSLRQRRLASGPDGTLSDVCPWQADCRANESNDRPPRPGARAFGEARRVL